MPNPETYNLRQLINNHFFDRDQTKEILENFVTVNNGVLHVGLPEPTNIALTTPNNAITTADMGTLKAKVTGASNVNCYGVPVEFVNKKTQKILGYGLTDLNGEVYHNFRLDDADIFDVQARLSQDYLFNDFGMLNNTHTWNNNSNIVREIYEDHTKIYLDDDTSYGYLCSPVLSGFVDIDFKVKLNDGAITDTFCGLFTTDSSGTVSGALNGFNLGQLGLTSADIGRWVDFHIGVLDDTIVLLCKDTGAMVKLSHTCPSYYIFSFALTGTLTSLDFKGVKINKCSDDLTMFVKDKDNLAEFNIWSGTDYLNNTDGVHSGHIQKLSSSSDFSVNGNNSFKINFDETGFLYINFININVVPDESYSASIKVYTNNNKPFVFRLIEPLNTHVKDVQISSMDSIQTVMINNFTTNTTGSLRLQVNNNNGSIGVIYVDEIILIKN